MASASPSAVLIAAIDAGSPRTMGWAIHAGGSGCGEAPDRLVAAILGTLDRGVPVALGIEAPLWIPAGRAYPDMTRSRGGIETVARRAWSASGGTGAMAAGLANLTWLLERVAGQAGRVRITTQPDRLLAGTAAMLIWEAFVSGTAKAAAGDQAGDARIAVDACAAAWPQLRSQVPPAPAVNLAAAVIAATGHAIDPDKFGLAVPVIAPV